MGQRLVGGDAGQLGPGTPAESATTRGQHQPADLARRAAAQALGERGVLRVDRDELSGAGDGAHQRAAGHQ